MAILVTGGAGYIGSHTAVELLNNNEDLIIIDNFYNSKSEVLERIKKITKKDFKFYEMDYTDKKSLEKVFQENKIDAVIHFAGYKAVGESVEKPIEYYSNNVGGTLNLLSVMKEYNVKKIIFSSSATVYGTPKTLPIKETDDIGGTTNPYGTSKLFIEKILTDLYNSDNTWSIAILRYFNPVGAHSSSLIGEDPNGIPNNLIDLAKGHVKTLDKINKEKQGLFIYNLGTGKGYSVLEIIKVFEKVTGQKIEYEFTERRKGDIDMCYADVSKARKELDFSCEKTLEDMCKDAWEYVIKKNNY